MSILLLDLLHKYWKSIATVGLSLFLILGAYYRGYEKGKNTVIRTVEHTVYVEVEKRHKEADTEANKIDREVQRIRSSREERPLDDKRDSCLLSNDPFEKECVQ